MLDAFAGLLVELHLAGCYWGDCSLSNVLYRYDADSIEALMIDAETVELHDQLSDGQRYHDLDIMEINVAGGMADIADGSWPRPRRSRLRASAPTSSPATSRSGTSSRKTRSSASDERHQIRARIERLNELGFEVGDCHTHPRRGRVGTGTDAGQVGGRNYHSNRLRQLTRIDASENQARQILSDLHYHRAREPFRSAPTKDVSAMMWRVQVFEPLMERIQR